MTFFRGMVMQVAVQRDEQGASNYSMCAVNPSRISKLFDERMLRFIIKTIVGETGRLLEIVNFNISNRQYVCAGELITLDCLTEVLHYITTQKPNLEWINRPGSGTDEETSFSSFIRSIVRETQTKQKVVELKRGTGITPLQGIDVPFHSTLLRPGVGSFRECLASEIHKSNLDVKKLVGRWIPNVTGKPFRNDREYFELVYSLTGSTAVKGVLEAWKGKVITI
jgi:fatty acid synthase subunit beta